MSDILIPCSLVLFVFFNDTATTEIYTLSLHDALPISLQRGIRGQGEAIGGRTCAPTDRSEEPTSELQSPDHLVCRLLLEKKKQKNRVIFNKKKKKNKKKTKIKKKKK